VEVHGDVPLELLTAARCHRDELTAILQAEAAALRVELAGWLERWEVGCRWFAADPRRAESEAAYVRLREVAAGWGEALEALEALAPGDPALALAHERMDKAFTVADADLEWNVG
jgi:hypothetical protein